MTTSDETSNTANNSSDDSSSNTTIQEPGTDQVDDPIIVKGGSVELSFDKDRFQETTPGKKSRRFVHDKTPMLLRMKIFRNGLGEPEELQLSKDDVVVICYTNSECQLM